MPTLLPPSRLRNPALFLCDIQDKFRSAIYEFPKVISTTQKMVKAAKILDIPIYVSTQNAAKLGQTVSEIVELLPPELKTVDKTAFSMMVPEMAALVVRQGKAVDSGVVDVLLVGIETHICVTQTALDLLGMGHRVYVLQDGVSSCNAGERTVALARLAREGCTVTTSESVLYEIMKDAEHEVFRAVSKIVKESKEDTRAAVEVFCGGGSKL